MKINNREVVANDSFLFCLHASVTSYSPCIGFKIDLRQIIMLVHLRCLRIDSVRSERYCIR